MSELGKKVKAAVTLLKAQEESAARRLEQRLKEGKGCFFTETQREYGINPGLPEIAYSGGKDSDVLLWLAGMAGIKHTAVYKTTTVDPPGTIAHAREKGAVVIRPRRTYFSIVRQFGIPSRFRRNCCGHLKEYAVSSTTAMGVRRSESAKRAARYKEPTECRAYAGEKETVEAWYPMLEWTDADVAEFVAAEGVRCHPLYYREDGSFDVSKRLGCVGCPLAGVKKRVSQYMQYPGLARACLRNAAVYIEGHPDATAHRYFDSDPYDYFFMNVFCDNVAEYRLRKHSLFGTLDTRAYMEEAFGVDMGMPPVRETGEWRAFLREEAEREERRAAKEAARAAAREEREARKAASKEDRKTQTKTTTKDMEEHKETEFDKRGGTEWK